MLLGLVAAAVTIATTAGPLTTLHLLQAVLRLQRSVGSAQTPLPHSISPPSSKASNRTGMLGKTGEGREGEGRGGKGRSSLKNPESITLFRFKSFNLALHFEGLD